MLMASTFKTLTDEVSAENVNNYIDLTETTISVSLRKAKGGISQMKAIAEAALAEEDGVDFGPLSHEERLKILLNR